MTKKPKLQASPLEPQPIAALPSTRQEDTGRVLAHVSSPFRWEVLDVTPDALKEIKCNRKDRE